MTALLLGAGWADARRDGLPRLLGPSEAQPPGRVSTRDPITTNAAIDRQKYNLR